MCVQNTIYFLENPDNLEELQAFKNLVLLFSELIEHDVFSHDLYVNMLISRGDLSPGICLHFKVQLISPFRFLTIKKSWPYSKS